MTMMINFDTRDLDLLDEDYFGPPPRFLTESRPSAVGSGEPDFFDEGEDGSSALDKLKSFFGILFRGPRSRHNWRKYHKRLI